MDRPFDFDITILGSGAKRALVSQPDGQVLAVFRRSFYLEMADGSLACIGPETMGAGPLNALARLPHGLDWEASGLASGSPAHIGRNQVTVGGRFAFNFGAASVWRPARPPAPPAGGTLAAGLRELRRMAAGYELAAGLASLVKRERTDDSPVVRAARPGIRALDSWLMEAKSVRCGIISEPPVEAETLIGLGTGLTPSGDDYLGGVLIALRALGHDIAADALARRVLPRARTATGRISAAHLACAAHGEGAAALHGVILSLCTDRRHGLSAHLAEVDAIGHSSGWDALAGAVAVLSASAASQ